MVRQQARVSHPPLASQERSGWPVGRARRRSPRFQEGRRRTPTGGCGRCRSGGTPVRRRSRWISRRRARAPVTPVPGSPTGSAAASSSRRRDSGASASSRRRKLSSMLLVSGRPPESPKPPASSAGVNPRTSSSSASGCRASRRRSGRGRARPAARPARSRAARARRPLAGPRPPAPPTPPLDRRRLATGGCERPRPASPYGHDTHSPASVSVGGPTREHDPRFRPLHRAARRRDGGGDRRRTRGARIQRRGRR